MLFKRPQVRYSDTPEPVTPYQAAAQVWDNRIGSARVPITGAAIEATLLRPVGSCD